MKCPKHPRYQAKRKPVRTRDNPKGCPICWVIWLHKPGGAWAPYPVGGEGVLR